MKILLFILTCANTEISNTSGLKWNDHDNLILNVAKKRCASLYDDSPCLVKFVKTEKLNYHAICGEYVKF